MNRIGWSRPRSSLSRSIMTGEIDRQTSARLNIAFWMPWRAFWKGPDRVIPLFRAASAGRSMTLRQRGRPVSSL